MSNFTVSSVSPAALPDAAPRFAALQNTQRSRGRDDDSDGGGSQGLNLFSALLQALVSAASQAKGGSATPPSSASSATTGATSATTATTPSSTGTAGSSLPQDLGAFLHDLFHALRQAGRQESEGRHLQPLSSATTSPASSTGTIATTGTTASGGTTSSSSGNPGLSSYRAHGLIGALQQLIQDLSSSQVVSATATGVPAPGISQNTVSRLNSAFQRLIADLGGTSSSPSASQSDTTALKSFLQGFLQDLQNGNTSGGSGNLINAAA